MNYELRIKNLIFIIFLFLLLASPVLAQEFNYPNLPGATPPQNFLTTAAPEDIPGLWVNYIINLLTWGAGMLAFGALVWAGIKFITSTGKPDKIIEARKQVSGAFLGLLIILTAYFVLETISPYFVDFTLPQIQNFQTADVPAPPTEESQKSSVDSYIPFGRIIENIFQTYISNPTDAQQGTAGPEVPDTLTRIQRVTNILDATGVSTNQAQTNAILTEIMQRTDNIRNFTQQCDCSNTQPDPPCSSCAQCPPIPPLCTCDPCNNVRGNMITEIQDLQPWLFGNIDSIVQHDAYGAQLQITTNLTIEIERLEEEVKDLKIWFDRLARSQEFIQDCDWFSLNNRNQFFQKKDDFEAKGWVIEDVAFYDDLEAILNIPVNPTTLQQRWYPAPGTPLEEMADESTLYCAVGGTYVAQPSDYKLGLSLPDPFEGKDDITDEDIEAAFTYEMACDITVPFGEVLDKVHRTARLFLNHLELILDREKKILEASVEIQRLTSQCSSRRCVNICICIPPPVNVCIPLGCQGDPCPDEIEDLADDIQRYVGEVQDAINGIAPFTSVNEIGINQIFNYLVPDLLQGMQTSLRDHMTKCTFEKEVDADVVLYTCKQAIGGTDEIDKVIRQCDQGTNNLWQDTLYGGCLDRCISSRISTTPQGAQTTFFADTDYRNCVNECMDSLCIYNYNHNLNFHCCHYKL